MEEKNELRPVYYLDRDKSIYVEKTENGYEVQTTHQEGKNASNLKKNLRKILKVKTGEGFTLLSLNEIPFVKINEKTGEYEEINSLTAFETRFSSQNDSNSVPFERVNPDVRKMRTDLHTHLSGHITPEDLIDVGLGHDIRIDVPMLEKIDIDTSDFEIDENNKVLLDELVKNSDSYQKLVNSMKIDTSEQETFNKMEEIYSMRNYIAKRRDLFADMIWAMARDAQKHGVEYMEFSVSNVITDISLLDMFDREIPKMEKECGVKIRFLGAIWRHSDPEWVQDCVDKLAVVSKSPWVVGCDFMGHETNSTMDFYDSLKDLARMAMKEDPSFVIRVHAGENPLFRKNVRQVLLAVEEAHYELLQETGTDYPYPQVRIGHGIYGMDEAGEWNENPRTKDITMDELCDMIKPIVEFNMSSNLSLNNINSLKDVPIKQYIDKNMAGVLGTDGRGIYSTSLEQEMILAKQAGVTDEDFEKISKVEDRIIDIADRRYREFSKHSTAEIKKLYENCYRNGKPAYTSAIDEMHRQEAINAQIMLSEKIANAGAETDLRKITKATRGKKPIMITGSSAKHWANISPENKQKIRKMLYVMINCLDPEKTYIVTGGTNYGVEKEAHIIGNEYNVKHPDNKLVILGTLTEEAAKAENNDVEPNTITHAMIPTLYGKPASRWFDLPDCVLSKIQDERGMVLAIGGGPIVSDIIQRSHNTGMDMALMAGVEGASGEKSVALGGNGYDFETPEELLDIIQDTFGKKSLKANVDAKMINDLMKEADAKIVVKTKE